jgi:uncharacterized protein YyaL (SSP411 family)
MIQWSPWSVEAFERARREHKPVLLSLTAAWCHACHEMHRTSFADPAVAALVNEAFVPLLVDSDERPDINERYNLGGWPTTALLTPRGEILTGGTFFQAAHLRALLSRVAESFHARQDDSAVPVGRDGMRPAAVESSDVAHLDVDWDAPRWVRDDLVALFDATHGGFGVEPKFPHASALLFARNRCRQADDTELATILTVTLDRMGWGGLYDAVEGGFFRYSAARDWSLPHSEKLLDENAPLIVLYCDAWRTFDHRPYRNKAIDTIRYVHTTLADRQNGGFCNSQRADTSYYLLTEMYERQRLAAPPVDPAKYVDANAAMVSAYLHAGEVLEDDTLSEFAIDSFDRLMSAVYSPGEGVRHAAGEDSVGGLLTDHVRAATALLDGYDASAREPYLMLAEELTLYALRTMWDQHAGGFFDRAPAATAEVPLLRERTKPFALNCAASRVASRLALATNKPEYRDLARRALASQTAIYRQQGPSAAEYALAVDALR